MASRLQIRRDTQANWTSNSPTLAAGEIGYETDTGLLKIGDGVSAYTNEGYATGDYYRLTANGTAVGPTIADFFPVNYPMAASGIYEFEYFLSFLKTTAGTATFTLSSSTAPVNLMASYTGGPVAGIATAGAPITAGIVNSTATAAALPATTSLTTAVNHNFVVRGFIENGASTNFIKLQITQSAGTVTPLRGSYIRLRRLPNANYGMFA